MGKCQHCNDQGWILMRNADGHEEARVCYCQKAVENGKLRPLDGQFAYEKYLKRKNGRKKEYEIGD